MSRWKTEIQTVDVTRQGDGEGGYHISSIEVRARRYEPGGPIFRAVFAFGVAADRVASLRSIRNRGSGRGKGDNRVHVHHVIALLPIVEEAVESVPDVYRTEALEDTIGSRRGDGDD